jgi:hypothetical protein
MPVLNALSDLPVQSVSDAIRIMETLDRELPDADGVKWFNRLYLRVTQEVNGLLAGTTFGDPAFVSRLDVVFANLYFDALLAHLTGSTPAPAAWLPLLRARHSDGIARIQFALAGMNAHINRDLPAGVVRTFTELGGSPLTSRVRERDFDSINDVLEQVEAKVKADFAVGPLGILDRLGGPVDDALAMWNVRAARAAAWTNAQVMWGLRRSPRLRDAFFTRLDGTVGMSSRGLLFRLRPLRP